MRITSRSDIAIALVAMLATGAFAVGPTHADETSDRGIASLKTFSIAAQPAAAALNEFAKQADITLVFSYDLVAGAKTKALNGSYSVNDALDRMLEGTTLSYQQLGERTVAISDRSSEKPTAYVADQRSMRLAQADQAPSGSDSSSNESNPLSPAPAVAGESKPELQKLEEIIVTGTHLRGPQDIAAPLIQITRDEIDKAGYATLEGVFTDLPQNFSDIGPGAANAYDGTSALSLSNSGDTIGANLRGLGARSTLTLLNGTRRAGGIQGQVVDLSSIPLSMVERIDVVTGGRSAIYGADAVAGVVNIVTRRSFSGAETQAYYGTPSGYSGASRIQLSQLFGATFDRGGFLAAYDFAKDDNLDLIKTGLVVSPLFGADQLRNDIQPDLERHALYLSGRYALNDRIELQGDANYANRKTQSLDRTREAGATGESFSANQNESDQVEVSMGAGIKLSSTWALRLAAASSQSKDDNPGEVYYDFGSFTFRSAGRLKTDAMLSSLSAIADGALRPLGWLEPRMALGVEARRESLKFSDSVTSSVFNDDDRTVRSIFTEVVLPLARPGGAQHLDASVAARYDDYDDFGGTFNPQVGLSWSPLAGVSFSASYGKAFRAPALRELGSNTAGFILNETDPLTGGVTPVLFQVGSRADLGPERAKTWSAGIDWQPSSLPQTRLSLSYFEVHYKESIDTPAIQGGIDRVLIDADYFADLLDRTPAASDIDSIRNADADGIIDNYTGIPYDPASQNILDVFPDIAIFDNRTNNIALEEAHGLDLTLDTQIDAALGTFSIGFNGSYTLDHDRNVTVSSPAFSRLNEVGKPVDLRLRANAGWARNAIGIYTYVNYTDGYSNPFVVPAAPIGSWTTFDLTLRYDGAKAPDSAVLGDFDMTLSVDNLFDRNPPRFIGGTSALRYDGTNASPIGRFVSVRLARRW